VAVRRWKPWLVEAAMVVVTVAMAVLLPRHVAFTAVAENWAADSRATLFAVPQPPHSQVVVVAITEDTLAQFPYRFPVNRGFLANLVDGLGAAGARAIGFDVLFDQATEAAKDQAFRDAVARFPGLVVAGWTDRETGLTERQADFQAHYLDGIRAGYSNTLKDVSDSTIRRAFPGREGGDGAYRPGFVPLLARELGAAIPDGPFPIVYRVGLDGQPAIRSFPAHTVRLLPKAWFKDKVVLVGADLPFEDRHRTPLAAGLGRELGTLPGVMVHAHALAQLLDGVSPPRASPPGELAGALFLSLAALGIGLARWRMALRIGAAIAVLGLFWVFNAVAYRHLGLALPVVAPSAAFAVMLALAGYYATHLREVETRFIRDAFSRYVAPGLVARLQEHPENLALGGEKREVTLLFSDVEGFTTMSESLDAAVLVAVLNEYLEGMVECVHRHGGMVDKFIGDAVMAIFGAPEPHPDHAGLAIACAMDMQAFAQEFQARQKAAGIGFGRTRIGVHSGPAVVGNVGGSRRFDYTAIGDTVNTASRLEGVNKYFGTAICVSETAASAAAMALRPIGRLVVKGRSEALGTFTPIVPGEEELAADYAAAFAALEKGDPAAAAAFARLSERHPDDALSRFHAKRLEHDPPSDLIVMKDK
jgi:class 3 adenylate cyclase/CHASE2 domain-containing sensor protein